MKMMVFNKMLPKFNLITNQHILNKISNINWTKIIVSKKNKKQEHLKDFLNLWMYLDIH
jgi:hypothetical protein